jgi:hypothetical protein
MLVFQSHQPLTNPSKQLCNTIVRIRGFSKVAALSPMKLFSGGQMVPVLVFGQ